MQLHSSGKQPGGIAPAEMTPGMTFAYEQPLSEWREAIGERARILTLRYVGKNGTYGERHVFNVVGAATEDDSWGCGLLFLDVQTVDRSLGNALRWIP